MRNSRQIVVHTQGFTLIELIIVATIISILMLIAFVSFSTARSDGRDTSRINQATEYLKALELYFSDNGFYPPETGGTSAGGGAIFLRNDNAAGQALLSSGHISDTQNDPNGLVWEYCADDDESEPNGYALLVPLEGVNGLGGGTMCHIERNGPIGSCAKITGSNAAATPCTDVF